MNIELLTISEAARILGVSIQTLRRWDDSGKLKSVRVDPNGHRHYRKQDLELFVRDAAEEARSWVTAREIFEPDEQFYCPNSNIFQLRLMRMQNEMGKVADLAGIYQLLTALAGEIGNNSFDHNLGNWPDLAGVFFAYQLNRRQIVLADRGQGLWKTLVRVKPDLCGDKEAIDVAFTKVLTGRAPEDRGNGLKFVRQVVTENSGMNLFFQSGAACLDLRFGDRMLKINLIESAFHGSLAIIKY